MKTYYSKQLIKSGNLFTFVISLATLKGGVEIDDIQIKVPADTAAQAMILAEEFAHDLENFIRIETETTVYDLERFNQIAIGEPTLVEDNEIVDQNAIEEPLIKNKGKGNKF